MKYILPIAALFALTACATAPAQAPVTLCQPAGYDRARLGVLFHVTDSGGNIEDLRLAESADVVLGPSTKKSYT